MLTVAITSTAFTGQAIAVGFDRRMERSKARRHRVPAGASSRQVRRRGGRRRDADRPLTAIATAFGWRPDAVGIGFAVAAIILGTVMFATLGLALGGTGKAEVVLALANLIWFVLAGFASLAVLGSRVPDAMHDLALATPSGAPRRRSESCWQRGASTPSPSPYWWCGPSWGGAAAVRWFRFD